MKRIKLFALLLILLCAGCSQKNPMTAASSPPVLTQGKIALGAVPVSLRREVAAGDTVVSADTSTSVELGVLKTTKAFFFIVRNVGGAPIDSLVITTDDSAMSMTPGYIPVLNTDATASLQQIAELDVTHGSDIGNRSFRRPLLPYGRQVFHLRFDGVSAGQPFHSEFAVGLAAVYVDFAGVADMYTWTETLAGGGTKLDTLLGTGAKLLPTASYAGVACSVLATSKGSDDIKDMAVGDTTFMSPPELLNETTGSKWLSTDCAVAPEHT